MIIAITILSILLVGTGFIVTEKNAKYLLAGYNTMTEVERSNFDIQAFMPYFRRFHVFLGLSLFVFSILLYYFVNPDWSGIFMVIYPIVAYIYFTWKTSKFLKQSNSKQKRKRLLSIGILLAVLVGVSGMFIYSLQDNTIVIKNDVIEIKGDYGMDMSKHDIKTIELVDSIPRLSIKLNGFALANVKKGYFKTKSGEKIKLFLNNMNPPFIYIQTKDNLRIYYSSKDKSNEAIFEALKNVMNN